MSKLSQIGQKAKEYFERKDVRQLTHLMGIGWGIIYPGQFVRLLPSNGGYVAPPFVRHHLSNVADGWTAAASLDYVQMSWSAVRGKKIQSRPCTCAGAALSLCTVWEIYTGQMPNRKFDWVDQSLHTLSAAAYVGVRRRQISKQKTSASTPG